MKAAELIFTAAWLTACPALLAAAYAGMELGLAAREVRAEIPAMHRLVDEHATVIEYMGYRELEQARTDLANRLDRRAGQALGIADRRLRDVTDQIAGARKDLDTHEGQIASSAASMAEIRQDLSPAVAGVNSMLSTDREALPAQTLGLVRDARFTAAEAGRAAGTIQRAMPEITQGVKTVVTNSDTATSRDVELHNEAIQVMQNLKADTKPSTLAAKLAVTIAVELLHVFF